MCLDMLQLIYHMDIEELIHIIHMGQIKPI
jgi:hypothetical protein